MQRRGFLFGAGTCLAACRPSPAATAGLAAGASPEPTQSARPISTQGVAAISTAEFASRCRALGRALVARGYDFAVIEPGPNMRYLTGVRWRSSERLFVLVVGRGGDLAWVCPAFEQRRALEQIGAGATLKLWQEHENPFATVADLVGSSAAVLVDGSARAWVYAGVAGMLSAVVLSLEPFVELRLHKSPAEIDCLRRANEVTKAAIAAACRKLSTGTKPSEFAEQVRLAQQRAGLSDVWVLALFGPAAAFPHGTHEDLPLKEGQMVLVDTGGALHGYQSDVTRTWAHGQPTEQARRAWLAVAQAQEAALKAIRPGTTCGEVDAAARSVIEHAGFGSGYTNFTHRLGHGIGLQVHEPPYLRPGNQQKLEPGMTMSNEPGIYIPGSFGVRLEDIVVVRDGPAEVLGPRVGPLHDPLASHG